MPRTIAFASAFASAVALAATLFSGAALAQSTPAQPSAAACDGVQQDKAACQREAGAARQEAGRNGLTTGSASALDANALARCKLQPAADQADCEARVRGASATGGSASTSGSVMGGGVIRETVTPVPAPATAPAR